MTERNNNNMINDIQQQSMQHYVMVSVNEFNRFNDLDRENIDLRATILNLSNQERCLKATIVGNEEHINALKRENEELKKNLSEFADVIKNNQIEIEKLRDENSRLSLKLNQLEKHIQQIEDDNKKMNIDNAKICNRNTRFK